MGILSYIKSIFLGKEETTQNNQTLPVDTKVVVDQVSETKVEEPKVGTTEEKSEVVIEDPVVEVGPNKSPKNAPKKRPSPKKKPVKSENKTEKPKKSKNTKK